MKNLISIFLVFISLSGTIAQTKLLTMEEAVVKQRTSLAPAKMKQLMWVKNSNYFSYVDIEGDASYLVIKDPNTNKEIKRVTILQLSNAMLTQKMELNQQGFPTIQWKNEKQFTFESNKKILCYDIRSQKITIEGTRDIGPDTENIDIAPKTNYIAYRVKNNLFVFDGKEKLIVTNDADENIENGRSVHREEWGIVKGTFWSPNGTQLAFYKMDQTMVTDYPIINWQSRPAVNTNIKYPMAGDKSHEVTVGIYNVSNGKTVFLKTGEPKEQYLTNIAWSPDEQHIYIAVLNRAQNELKLNSYSSVTGYFEKTLFEEKNEKYVHPTHTMSFVTAHNDQFIWQSERDGYNHLYLYDTNGKLIKQLTKGNWIVTDLAGFDTKGTKAFYSSTAESPITRNFYSVDLKSGATTKITTGTGTHSITFNTNGYSLDNFQSTKTTREVSVYNAKGKKLQTLYTAANPLSEYALGSMDIFTLKSESGEDLYCRLYKPVPFDETKKYPVIVYLYNGPNVQMINDTWNGGGDLWFQYMAQRGFVVFTMDGRGSGNRGLAFEQAVFRNLGIPEVKDQVVGVNYLKELKFVDSNRMGIFGWSYGGFMTTTIMTRHPELFKVGVAGGPVIDWSYYEIMYTERYMDTPQENPEGYKNSRLINVADKLKGKLMIIHGAQDPTVVWQHSMQFIKECVDKKKQVDYFVYPGHEHNVIGKDREHLYQKVTDYFMQNL